MIRTFAWGLVCAVAGALLLVAGARWAMPEEIAGSIGDAGWTARTRGWFTSRGFQGAELDPESARQYSWTSGRARVVIPHLSRAIDYRLTFDINAFRLDHEPPPAVTIAVDGRAALTAQTTIDRRLMTVDLPRRSNRGVIVTIEPSATFVPGPDDARVLGVMVSDVRLQPVDARFRPSWPALGVAALAIGLAVVGALLCGLPRALEAGVAAATTVGFVWLLLIDAAFLGNDVYRLLWIGGGAAAIGGAVAAIRAQWPVVAGLPEWAAAVGGVLGVSVLKLAVFTHPQIAQTDAMFQVHRAQLVHRGEYFFTSVTPSPGFEFPYAVLLYVTALPFWSWFRTEQELADLLRGLALVADALVGVALYAVVRRQWQHAPVALCCAVLWTMTRAPSMALGHANLTNLFGQGLFGVAMGYVAWMAAGARASMPAVTGAVVALTLAFLSHFSALSTGVLLVSAVVGVLAARGGPDLRRVAAWSALALVIAAGVSYAAYYSHFTDLYRETFTRIVSGADEATTNSMLAPPALKFQRWITEDQFSNDYGLPGVAMFLTAVLGLVSLIQRRPREGLTLVLIAWALVWAIVSAMGILTSVELRTNLAAAPMFVCLAAYGLWHLAAHSPFGRVVAVVGVAAIAWDGLRVWLYWLGLV